MDRVLSDLQPGLGTTAIVGELTLTKTGTTARTATFPDASITVAGLGLAQTWTADQTFDVIKTQHCDAATSAGVHIGNASHQDVAIFGAGGGQGTTFYGQINGTTLSMSGQITSTVTTGSSPFVVASTTKVANLNVDYLNGATWAAPGAIGGTTPAAGAFTTLTASGDITVANTGGGASAALTAGTFGQMLKWQRYGYSTSYTALQIGNATYGLSFGYDHSPNGGGQFYGDNRDIFFRRGAHIGCANAGGTDFVWALRISGGAVSNGAHILELTDDVASFLGNAPGTPVAGEVQIGAGQIKTGSDITCAGDIYAKSSSGVRYLFADGGSSGTGAGSCVITRTGGTNRVVFGNRSAITGGTFDSTPVVYMNGVQVLTVQGAAVADATDAASAITQLNALLARARAHGFIAT